MAKKKYSEQELPKKMNDETKMFKKLLKLGSIFGVGSNAYKEVDSIQGKLDSLIGNIDKFNECFGPLGWVATGSFNSKISEDAISLYDQLKIDEAEELLCVEVEKMVSSYNSRLNRIDVFRVRKNLIDNAIKDHKEGRYHASVPVILLCIDGIVNDIVPEQKGLYAKGEHLEIDNSIVGHSGGLPSMMKLICKARGKTNNEEISVPYRHGILHGRDTNYGTRLVSCKCLGLIIAIRDWTNDLIRKIEEGKLTSQNEPSFAEIIQSYKDTQELKKQIADWKRRDSEEIDLINIVEGTPESMLIKQFEFWKSGNYGALAKSVSAKFTAGRSCGKYAGDLARSFDGLTPISVQLTSVEDKACAMTRIGYILKYKDKKGDTLEKSLVHNVLYVDEDDETICSNMQGGEWKMVFGWDIHLGLD